MKKIYIDITNLVEVKFLTGIQRVVRNVILEMVKNSDIECVFLSYVPKDIKFHIIDNTQFIEFLKNNYNNELIKNPSNPINYEAMGSGNIFFDIDSVWNSKCKRNFLLPKLKKFGLKIAVYIYDIIPINYPQYSNTNTIYSFMNYIGAHLQHADLVITSTQTVLDEVKTLIYKLNLKEIPGYVSWLGSDFNNEVSIKHQKISKKIRNLTKKKYVLCVGTIEPRKNHKLILEAFEKELFNRELNLIFVGRIGWNVETFEKKMKSTPYYNKKFFHFEGLDDNTVNYLYKNAYLLAFPTYTEGFGLPMIEAFERNVPVIATDCQVLREVGQDYCEYFDPNNVDAVVRLITSYLNDENKYNSIKEKLKKFKVFTWENSSKKIIEALNTLKQLNYKISDKNVKQIVFLTARLQSLKNTLPYIEIFMPFIKEIILCCPDNMKIEAKKLNIENASIQIITDSELLQGKKLPDDHTKRNFLLRCQMMKNDKIDDIFIMSDDDYRPLEKIDRTQFILNGVYRAYYSYSDISKWMGTSGNMTSYDKSIFRTREFLEENQYPNRLYSAHMPQIIDKKLYLQMLNKHTGIENMGLDEWTTYFNFVEYHYPEIIQSEVYMTLGWPAMGTDWRIDVEPVKMIFENYYDEMYSKGRLFEGFSQNYSENTTIENEKKIEIYKNQLKKHIYWQNYYEIYKSRYAIEYGEEPSFVIQSKEDGIQIYTPQVLEIPVKGFIRCKWYFENFCKEKVYIGYKIKNFLGVTLIQKTEMLIECVDNMFELPIHGLDEGKYLLTIYVTNKRFSLEKNIQLMMITNVLI